MMDRRRFGRTWLLALAGAMLMAPMALVGCADFGSVLNYITLTLGIIMTVATPFLPPGISTIVALVKAGLADLSATVTQYEAAPAADKATLLEKINLIATEAITNFQQLIAQLLPNAGALISLIENLAQDILGAITGWLAELTPAPTPASAPVAAAKAGTLRLANTSITVQPWKCDAKQYKTKVNADLAAAGKPELALH
jgi:hypothetical protein